MSFWLATGKEVDGAIVKEVDGMTVEDVDLMQRSKKKSKRKAIG